MEKTASTTAVVNGSTSTAAQVIALNVDAEALCCTRWLHSLVPPVFQCAAGHLVCSSCHDVQLPDKNRCLSCFIKTGYTRCFIPTSYTRCHGVERILRTVRVACRNAMYGCTAGKMLYQEKEEHEKTCPINLAYLKMGPVGGAGGDPMEMDVCGVDRIVKVVVWHRNFTVDAMSVVYTYERDGREEHTEKWGRPAGVCSEICLDSDEYLTCVKGHVGHQDSMFIVKPLTFVSNRHTFGPYGKEQGAPFELPAAGGRIVGFHGRSDRYLDALGTYVKMVV